MHVWRDIGAELLLGLFLLVMSVAMLLTYALGR